MGTLSRRKFLGTAAGTGVAIAAGGAEAVLSSQTPQATSTGGAASQELTLVNGRIHTMDGRNTIARTVSIRNGRFVTVGDRTPARVPGVRVIDLKGRTVVPGLVEGHVHSVSLANRPGHHTILENTTSIREVQEALAARRRNVPEGQWITSMGGWHPNQWTERRQPTRQELDAAVPDRPGTALRALHWTMCDKQPRQGVLRCRRCRRSTTSRDQAGERRREWLDCRSRLCRGRAVSKRAISFAQAPIVRRQKAQHPRCDGVLGQRRPDRTSR